MSTWIIYCHEHYHIWLRKTYECQRVEHKLCQSAGLPTLIKFLRVRKYPNILNISRYIGTFPSKMRNKLLYLLLYTTKIGVMLDGPLCIWEAALTDTLVICKASNFKWVLEKNRFSISFRLQCNMPHY